MVENQFSSKTKCRNVDDLNLKHPSEDWKLKPCSIGRATRFINHPDNLPDVDISIDYDPALNVQRYPEHRVDTRYNLRQSIKVPTKMDFVTPHEKNARYK